jgi:ABC-type antimicrobial peptide transport system permease subunit
MFAKQGLSLAAIGIVAGLAMSFLVTRVLSSCLYGIGSRDLATFVEAPTLMLIVAIAAVLIPSFRAAHVQALQLIRYE